jgi:hypothetical protein
MFSMIKLISSERSAVREMFQGAIDRFVKRFIDAEGQSTQLLFQPMNFAHIALAKCSKPEYFHVLNDHR